MQMAKFKMIALTTPVPGRETDFHEWYQNTHLPELVGLGPITGAQRYQLVAKLVGSDTNPWLAIYDIECDDAMAFLGAMGEASTNGKLTQSDASDMATTYTAVFSEYGERVGV
jgi:hypothetical protein